MYVDRWRHTSVTVGVLRGSNLDGMRRDVYRSSVCYGSPAQWERAEATASSDLTTYLCVYICRTRNAGSARKHITHTTTNERVAHIIGIRLLFCASYV